MNLGHYYGVSHIENVVLKHTGLDIEMELFPISLRLLASDSNPEARPFAALSKCDYSIWSKIVNIAQKGICFRWPNCSNSVLLFNTVNNDFSIHKV
jgi:hypothetical protein